MASAASIGCGGLVAEAMLGGQVLRLPKHSRVFQLYGAVEEAEARLGLARSMAGDPLVAEALLLAERLVRAALHVAVTGDKEVVDGLLREAERLRERLGTPGGWSLPGCSLAEAEAAVAAAKAREADRLLAGLAEEGLLGLEVAEAASKLLAAAADLVYRARWRLCGERGSRSSRSLVLGGE